MDSLDNLTKKKNGDEGFFGKVFNFDENSRNDMLNLLQYTFLSIIPVIILNKSIQRFSPEANDEKNSLEILFEIIAQLVVIFIGLFFINRIVIYIPTYSGEDYEHFNLISIVLLSVMIMFSFQTKLGEKTNILVERLEHLWNGTTSKDDTNLILTDSSSTSSTTSLSNLPVMTSQKTQSSPDYNQFYANQETKLVGAATPGVGNPYQTQMNEGFNEIQPANEFLGGSGFGSSF